MPKSLGSKPANQGNAGKANPIPPRSTGIPNGAKPGKSDIKFSNQPSGTRGSKFC